MGFTNKTIVIFSTYIILFDVFILSINKQSNSYLHNLYGQFTFDYIIFARKYCVRKYRLHNVSLINDCKWSSVLLLLYEPIFYCTLSNTVI